DLQNKIKDPQAKITPLLKAQKVFIAQVILNTYVEAYRVITYGLENWNLEEAFDEKRFIDECLILANEMHYQGRIRRIEVASKPFLINGLRVAKNRNLIPTVEDPKKEALRAFLGQLDDVSRRIQSLQEIILERPRIINTQLPAKIRMVPGSKTYGITQEISDGESGSHIAAFFDMDRTLIKDFSAKEFFRTRLLSGRMTSKEIAAQFSALLIYASGNGGFAQMAAVGAQGIKGIKEDVFIEVGEEVYLKHLSKEIYPESRALVNAHLAKGHTVAIISAATPYQVNPVARDLDIDHVMCTRMEVKNGIFTGNIVEPACWGEGKVKAALNLKEEFDLDFSKSYFYTDSAEDVSLLEIVGNPRPINPDTKLTVIAFQNDWPIYRFDEGESNN
ncbi:MAG: HAD-IB family hydrolase, partial [Bacteroidota bacterium]